MAKRKSVDELVRELKLFNHHESAAKMESLAAELENTKRALCDAADTNDELRRRLAAYGDKDGPVFG